MDFHHLHVVDYGQNPVKTKTNLKDFKVFISKECQINEKILKRNSRKNIKSQQTKAVRKAQTNSTENCYITEIKDAVQRILPSVRTLSLYDIGKRLKKFDSCNIKQNFENRLKCSRLKINIRKDKKRKESQDDIVTLYASQKFGEQGSKNKERFKIDPSAAPCSKRPSKNVFRTQSMPCRWENKRLSNTNMNRNNGVQKSESVLSANRLWKTCYRAKRKDSCYNLAESFLSREFEVSNQVMEPLRTCTAVPTTGDKKEDPPRPLSGPATSSIIKPPMQIQTMKVNKRCAGRPGRTVVCKARRESKTIVANFYKVLTFLKYFLLAPTVIAFFPCFIVAFLCWYVVRLLTPDNVRADEVAPASLKCRKSFLSKLVECATRSFRKTVCDFKAVLKRLFCIGKINSTRRSYATYDIGKRLNKCDTCKIKQKLKNRTKLNRFKFNVKRDKEHKNSQDDLEVLYTSKRIKEQGSKNKVGFKIHPRAAPRDNRPKKKYLRNQSMPCRCNNKILSKTKMDRNYRVQKSESVLSAKRLWATCHHSKREDSCYNLANSFLSRELEVSNQVMGTACTCTTVPNLKSSLSLCKCTTNEVGTVTSSIIKPPMQIQTVKVDKRCGGRPGRTVTVCKARRESNVIVAPIFKMLLTFLKYCLLALTVIAWSPCFILAFVCWYVVSPLTPDDVRADELVPVCLKCRNSFFSKLVECVTRSYMKIVFVFKALKRSFCTGKITSKPRCYATYASKIDCQPNNDKKYILYHSEQRRWLPKPMMQGKHKPELPNQISSVYPVIECKRSRHKKSVSFWDAEVSDCYNESQTRVCQHKSKPSDTIKKVTSQFKSRTLSCDCLITETPKTTRRSVETSCHRSHYSLTRKQPSLLRKIYGACPHQKPVPRQRLKTCHSDTEIDKTWSLCGGPEGRRRSRSSSPRHICNKDQEMQNEKRLRCQQRCQERCKRQLAEKHHRLHCKKRCEHSEPKLAAGDRTRNKEPEIESKKQIGPKKQIESKQIDSTSVKEKKPPKKKINSNKKKNQWDFSCNPYLSTLKNKPCFWFYTLCPNMYPYCVTTFKMFESCCTLMLFICSACVWCPIFMCCYFCYHLICDCMCGCGCN